MNISTIDEGIFVTTRMRPSLAHQQMLVRVHFASLH